MTERLPRRACPPRNDAHFVILNEVKNLKVCETVESSTNLEILRFTQDDKQYVILNEVKNPLKADKRQRTQRIASEEILRVAQDDRRYVILNEVKNLKVCEMVESSTSLEILRFTQDDRVCERDCHGLFQASQ